MCSYGPKKNPWRLDSPNFPQGPDTKIRKELTEHHVVRTILAFVGMQKSMSWYLVSWCFSNPFENISQIGTFQMWIFKKMNPPTSDIQLEENLQEWYCKTSPSLAEWIRLSFPSVGDPHVGGARQVIREPSRGTSIAYPTFHGKFGKSSTEQKVPKVQKKGDVNFFPGFGSLTTNYKKLLKEICSSSCL